MPSSDHIRKSEEAEERLASRANDRQVAGAHYAGDYQVWDFVMDTNLNYLQGNAVKYITRAYKKNGLEDLEKAIHYLEKLNERNPSLVLYHGQQRARARFVAANNLSSMQSDAITAIINGGWRIAVGYVERMMTNYPT